MRAGGAGGEGGGEGGCRVDSYKMQTKVPKKNILYTMKVA